MFASCLWILLFHCCWFRFWTSVWWCVSCCRCCCFVDEAMEAVRVCEAQSPPWGVAVAVNGACHSRGGSFSLSLFLHFTILFFILRFAVCFLEPSYWVVAIDLLSRVYCRRRGSNDPYGGSRLRGKAFNFFFSLQFPPFVLCFVPYHRSPPLTAMSRPTQLRVASRAAVCRLNQRRPLSPHLGWWVLGRGSPTQPSNKP